MKKLLAIAVLGLFLITPSQADDIRDFEIEGMSIGDNALDFFSKSDINNATDSNYYKNKEYVYYLFWKFPSLEVYDSVQVTFKPDDKNYTMHAIDGAIYFKDNIKDCYKKQDQIKNEMDKFFKIKADKTSGKHPAYKTGNNKFKRFRYNLSEGIAEIICYDMDKKLGPRAWDALYVTLKSSEFDSFLNDEAYK